MSAALRWRISFPRSRRPSQSSSWRSASHASAPPEPSIWKRSAFLRPVLTCERTHEPRAPPSKRTRMCARSSVVIGASTRSTSEAAANVSTSPTGRRRTGIAVPRSAKTSTILRPVTNCVRSSQCEPMSPTARSSPPRCGLEPPVPVLGCREPVLEVAAVHGPDLPELAGTHPLARLLHERVEADVEVRAVHEPAPLGQLDELGGLRGGHRERLLADDVLARLERLLHLRVVEVVRRRQVDDVDPVVGEDRVVALVCPGEPLRRRALGRGARDARDLDPDPSQRVDVDGTDEARPDDRGPELGRKRTSRRARLRTLLGWSAATSPRAVAAARVRRASGELSAKHRVPGAVLGILHGGEVTTTGVGVLSKATGVEVTTRLAVPDRLDHQGVDGDAGDAARRRRPPRARHARRGGPARLPGRRSRRDPHGHDCATCSRTRAASTATSSPTPAAATTASSDTWPSSPESRRTTRSARRGRTATRATRSWVASWST